MKNAIFRTMEDLNISSFEKALNSLNSILTRYSKEGCDADIRDAVIQRFEYTYSLAVKMLVRFINLQSPETDSSMTFNEIIRTANQFGLLKNNLEKWTEYRQKRNACSDAYDDKIAIEVITAIPEFRDEAEFMLDKFKNIAALSLVKV